MIVGPSVAAIAMTIHNNFHLLRLFAAMLVLFSHAHSLRRLPEPLFLERMPLGPLGVYIFFSISGFLIYKSYRSDPNLLRFLAKRGLRLWPGLLVVVALSALVLGPLVSALPVADYMAHPLLTLYFWNLALYPIYHLPEVFSGLPYPGVVNGSIWSLAIEVAMYLSIPLALIVMRAGGVVYLVMFVGFAVLHFTWIWVDQNMLVVWGSDLRQLPMCGIFFAAGAAIAAFRWERLFTPNVMLCAAIALFCSPANNTSFHLVLWIALPILVIGAGSSTSPFGHWLAERGDLSYGTYLYAFPIQQLLMLNWPELSLMAYITSTVVLVLACAWLSWHFVEQPAQRLKPLRKTGLDFDGRSPIA